MSQPMNLDEIKPWLNPCGSCDYGLPMNCTCPKGDPRPVLLRLAVEVELLRKVVDRAERNNCGCLGYPIDQDIAELAALSAPPEEETRRHDPHRS